MLAARQAYQLTVKQQDAPRASSAAPDFAVSDMDFCYAPEQPLFRGFELRVAAGEFVALIGPSGCGKSSLLNLLAGFLKPTRGTITVGGAPLATERGDLGYVFQSPHLFPWLSALDNVRFGLRMAGRLSKAEQKSRALASLALVGLEVAADRFPHQLSGGMQQRVAIARTLVMRPRVLLMDEPFSALDAISRREMNVELLRLWSVLGNTVIFITHDIDEAVFLADRVVVLDRIPRGIHCQLPIELPRPRELRRTREHPRFAALCAELMDRIHRTSAAS